jgi:hypothetical protein
MAAPTWELACKLSGWVVTGFTELSKSPVTTKSILTLIYYYIKCTSAQIDGSGINCWMSGSKPEALQTLGVDKLSISMVDRHTKE